MGHGLLYSLVDVFRRLGTNGTDVSFSRVTPKEGVISFVGVKRVLDLVLSLRHTRNKLGKTWDSCSDSYSRLPRPTRPRELDPSHVTPKSHLGDRTPTSRLLKFGTSLRGRTPVTRPLPFVSRDFHVNVQ